MNTFRIVGDDRREPSHVDVAIVKVPDEVFMEFDGQQRLVVPVLREFLKGGTKNVVDGEGEQLHHADWLVTTDPDVIRSRNGQPSCCAACSAAIDQTLAYVADTGKPVLIGHFYYV